MKRLFLAPLLLSIGLISPVKAEPEWFLFNDDEEYFWDKGGFKTQTFIDTSNFFLTNDGMTIYAERKITFWKKSKGNENEYKHTTWKGINCDKRTVGKETGSKFLFAGEIPNTDKMSKREINKTIFGIEKLWKTYKLICKSDTPKTYINLNSLDVLDSEHPYKETVKQSVLDKLDLTYTQYQASILQHEKSKSDFKWKEDKIIDKNRKKGYFTRITKWNQLYLPLAPIEQPKINIKNKSKEYKSYVTGRIRDLGKRQCLLNQIDKVTDQEEKDSYNEYKKELEDRIQSIRTSLIVKVPKIKNKIDLVLPLVTKEFMAFDQCGLNGFDIDGDGLWDLDYDLRDEYFKTFDLIFSNLDNDIDLTKKTNKKIDDSINPFKNLFAPKSKEEIIRKKCLKAKDYAGCMEYERSQE